VPLNLVKVDELRHVAQIAAITLPIMLLSGALLALFMTGFWLYCLTDAILTPASECRGLSKPAWVAVIAVTFIAGAFAWLIVRQPIREQARLAVPLPGGSSRGGAGWTAVDDAAARHPAGRWMAGDSQRRPTGPDDDTEFLRALEAVIRRNPPVS
jgi:Phospholipase_D-nuclease N-terminal